MLTSRWAEVKWPPSFRSFPLPRSAVYGPFGGAQMTVKQAKDDAPRTPAPEAEQEQQAKEKEAEQEQQQKQGDGPAPAAEQPAAGGAVAACSLQLSAGGAPLAFAGCRRIVLGQTQMHLLWSSAPVAGNPAVRACCACCAIVLGWVACSRWQGPAGGGGRHVWYVYTLCTTKLNTRQTSGLLYGGAGRSLCSPTPTLATTQKTTLTLGLNATGAAGYVALGFPTQPGRMTGATAFLLAPSAGGATGAQLQQYYLAGERQSGEALLPSCC